jgi:hypothetical protein
MHCVENQAVVGMVTYSMVPDLYLVHANVALNWAVDVCCSSALEAREVQLPMNLLQLALNQFGL